MDAGVVWRAQMLGKHDVQKLFTAVGSSTEVYKPDRFSNLGAMPTEV